MKRNKWSKVLLGAALSAALIAGAQTEARAERVSSDYSDFIRGADHSQNQRNGQIYLMSS